MQNPHRNKKLGPYVAFNERAGKGKSISLNPHTKLFKFVEKVVQKYCEVFTDEAAVPVLRIDVFRRQDGRYVVNEIEHFEACVHPRKTQGVGSTWEAFLREFWTDQLKFMVKKHVNDTLST